MVFTLSAFADEAADDLSGQLAALADAGIGCLEIRGVDGRNIGDMSAAQAREIRRRLDDEGIAVSAIGSPYGKIKLTDDFGEHLEQMKTTLEAARILGASRMRMFSFFLDGVSHADARGEVIDRLGRMLETAQAAGIECCHENEKGIYGDTVARCLDLMEVFGGALRCVYDPANFIQCGEPAYPAFERLRPHITYYHIKDVDTATGCIVPAGEGDGGIVRLLAELKAAAGHTHLTLEPHLQHFSGLASLEEDRGESIRHKYRFENNRDSFAAAAAALEGCLTTAGYTKTAPGVWE